jgi:hypothetical protein
MTTAAFILVGIVLLAGVFTIGVAYGQGHTQANDDMCIALTQRAWAIADQVQAATRTGDLAAAQDGKANLMLTLKTMQHRGCEPAAGSS